MANGVTRLSLAKLQLAGKGGEKEMDCEMEILTKAKQSKIPLKAGASEHNHSN